MEIWSRNPGLEPSYTFFFTLNTQLLWQKELEPVLSRERPGPQRVDLSAESSMVWGKAFGCGRGPFGPKSRSRKREGWPQDPAPPHVCSHSMRTQNTLPSLAPDQLLCISLSLPNMRSPLFPVTCGTPQPPGALPTSLPTSPVSPVCAPGAQSSDDTSSLTDYPVTELELASPPAGLLSYSLQPGPAHELQAPVSLASSASLLGHLTSISYLSRPEPDSGSSHLQS